jgi:hypothetical protein
VPEGGHLGRLLFERPRAINLLGGLRYLASIYLVVSLLIVSLALAFHPILALALLFLAGVLGLVLLIVMIVKGLVYLWCWGGRFRFHDFGVVHEGCALGGLFGRKQLGYWQVGQLTWAVTRHFSNGTYSGTACALELIPLPELGLQPIAYRASTCGEDADLDAIRQHLARRIAERMEGQLKQGQPVVWTGELRFLPDGLEYLEAAGRQQPHRVVLPYRQCSFRLVGGDCWVLAGGSAQPVLTLSTGAVNFYPGLVLLERLGARRS